MKLKYRGVSYEYSTEQVEATSVFHGKYRGVDFQSSSVVQSSDTKLTSQLKYRGVAYVPNPSVKVANNQTLATPSFT